MNRPESINLSRQLARAEGLHSFYKKLVIVGSISLGASFYSNYFHGSPESLIFNGILATGFIGSSVFRIDRSWRSIMQLREQLPAKRFLIG